MPTGAAVPAPFSLIPSGQWDGNDGNWSTFSIGVGTPPQNFRILPSTTGAEVWLPYPPGCEGFMASVATCGMLRGVDNFKGTASRGFQTNASSTWDTIGIYELVTEQNLWRPAGNNGLYGLDTVSLQAEASHNISKLTSQTVAATASDDVWLGSLGLGTALSNFSVESQEHPSMLETMKTMDIIPSLSFGYTSGASYCE